MLQQDTRNSPERSAEIVPGQFERAASFVFCENDMIPDRSLEMARLLLIDTLSVTAGAARLPVSRMARDHAVRFLAAGESADSAPLLFDGRTASIPGAAFAAATQTDNLDGHDGYNPTKGHIGCAVVPALFAFAHHLPELSGKDAIAAMVVAYEIAARAGQALHATVDDYHTSGAWNGLGVAALGCRLRRSGERSLREAFGIAEYHGPRSQMMREIDNPSMLHDGSGMGALVGTQAVLLAEDGFTGAPAITVEAGNVSRFWEDLQQSWTVDLNYIKPYPICRWAHAAVDAIRMLVLQRDITPDEIASIEIQTFHEAARLFPEMPETTSQAQYSLRYAVATFLKHRRLGPTEIDGDALSDPEVANLLERISVRVAERHDARFPKARWSDATITLTNGTLLTSGDVHARGGVEAPMSTEELHEKFHSMVSIVMSRGDAEQIWEAGQRLLDNGFMFKDLAGLCARPLSGGRQ